MAFERKETKREIIRNSSKDFLTLYSECLGAYDVPGLRLQYPIICYDETTHPIKIAMHQPALIHQFLTYPRHASSQNFDSRSIANYFETIPHEFEEDMEVLLKKRGFNDGRGALLSRKRER